MSARGGMFERLLEDVCEVNDLSIRWTAFGANHGIHIDGEDWELWLAGLPSREEAAERVMSLMRRRNRLPGCDVCLNAGLVPSSDYPGHTAACGDCRGGGDDDPYHPSDALVRAAFARSLK